MNKEVDFQTYLYLDHNQFIIHVAEIFTNEMNEIYKNNLISNGFFDTFFLVIKK